MPRFQTQLSSKNALRLLWERLLGNLALPQKRGDALAEFWIHVSGTNRPASCQLTRQCNFNSKS
jgi:hypothetical protein